MRPRFGGLWRRPDFVRLWVGQSVSTFGSLIGALALSFTAVAWLDATPFEVSVLSASQLAPGFVVGLVAGVWVDRLPRRKLMIAMDVGRFLALATVPLAALLGVLTVWQLYGVALASSAMTVFFVLAYQAYLPVLVESDELVEGNAKLAASASLAEIGSFSLSGWLVQLLSGPGAMVIDAVSFLGSALFLGRIRTVEPPPTPAAERPGMWHEAKEGLRVVAGNPLLRWLTVTNAVLAFGGQMVGVAYLLYLYREVGFEPGVLGMVFAVGGVMSLTGTVFAGWAKRLGGIGRALVISVFMRAAGMLLMPLASSVSLTGFALLIGNQVVTDPAWMFYEVNDLSLRQGATAKEVQGRMAASVQFVEFGAMLAGTVVGGVVGEWLGVRTVLFLGCGITALAGVVLAVSPVARLREAAVSGGEGAGRVEC